MSNNDEIAFVVTILVTKQKLQEFINVINDRILYEDDEPLTVEVVLTKPKLLEYICKEAVEDGTAMYDPGEFWINDGWCDVRDYM